MYVEMPPHQEPICFDGIHYMILKKKYLLSFPIFGSIKNGQNAKTPKDWVVFNRYFYYYTTYFVLLTIEV